eukprot:CAMPEP_0179463938 /NCGR_PEP_ID=MMETSP0799-20121207/45871_1 /TAXON_ID=46947 /ORGANISM="Geminigera cryophila, Strain CCMP2564" /LENGTH=227 /DNA_ID=CAMNT_0021267455 /DNA_START=94 /DNA_END=773 /DNA_ORIENTATION=+
MLGHIKGMEGGFTPVCTVWAASLVGTSMLFNQFPDWKKTLFLHWPSVLRKKEYTRLVTNFGAFGGTFDMTAMIDLYFLCQSGMRIEACRSGRFLLALILLGAGLLYVDYNKYLFAERTPWLSHRLILSLVCLESWENPWHKTQMPPLPLPPFPSFLMPFLLAAQNCMLFGTPWKMMVAPILVSIPVHALLMIFDELRFQVAYLMSGGAATRSTKEERNNILLGAGGG